MMKLRSTIIGMLAFASFTSAAVNAQSTTVYQTYLYGKVVFETLNYEEARAGNIAGGGNGNVWTGWVAVSATPRPDLVPVYKCNIWNSVRREHHMSSRDSNCENNPYGNKGILGYIYAYPAPGTVALSRYYTAGVRGGPHATLSSHAAIPDQNDPNSIRDRDAILGFLDFSVSLNTTVKGYYRDTILGYVYPHGTPPVCNPVCNY